MDEGLTKTRNTEEALAEETRVLMKEGGARQVRIGGVAR